MVQFSFRWKENLRFGSVEPSPATVHRTVGFDGSNPAVLNFSKIKGHPKDVLFVLVLVYTLDICALSEVPARFVAISFRWKEIYRVAAIELAASRCPPDICI